MTFTLVGPCAVKKINSSVSVLFVFFRKTETVCINTDKSVFIHTAI